MRNQGPFSPLLGERAPSAASAPATSPAPSLPLPEGTIGAGIGAMAGDSHTVERSATIDAAPERVHEQVADFRRWASWSPWDELDPNSVEGHRGGPAG